MEIPVTLCTELAVVPAWPATLPLLQQLPGKAACQTQRLRDFPNSGLALHGCEVLTIPIVFQEGEDNL